ncbi:FAD-dependent oxidoreductase, partial [Burkholderia cenocepacia]|uniref:FAD-dependent oxidoreductase n=1 Tax=Burkholderia cenocepacia TaxID=95486 RepID=UPI003211BB3F|nr:hypothetical protein [Burkholderia cenocepacia]
ATRRAGDVAAGRLAAVEHAALFEDAAARTTRGEVRADVLVLACNAYVDRLDRDLARRLLPVGTYQVATAPLAPDVARALLPRNSCVIDNQFVPDYFRLSPDNRLL